jgi:hypothetical protein
MKATKNIGKTNPHIIIYILAVTLTLVIIFGGRFFLKYLLQNKITPQNTPHITQQTLTDAEQTEGTELQIQSGDASCFEDADFRNVKWGMSPDEIRNCETIHLEMEVEGRGTVLKGDTKIGGKNCVLIYSFLDNKLMRALYNFTELYADSDSYYDDFQSVDEMLKDIYGKPIEENAIQPRKTGQGNIGNKILRGEVGFKTKWNAKNENYIIHRLFGANLKALHWIEFTTYPNKSIMDAYDAKKTK